MRSILGLVIASSVLLSACATVTDDDDPDALGEVVSELSGAQRRQRAEGIRNAARARGMTNAALLAGIADVETNMAHCWSEATWACKGPHSSFCNGPVIAGASDGPCSAQQGGLGMFQFDAGNYAQTLAREGRHILELDGNVSNAVTFVARVVREEERLASNEAAIEWLNATPIANGNARFERWKKIMACRYNGACGSAAQANKYGNAAIKLWNEMGGAGFWGGSGGGEPGGECKVRENGRLYCANGVSPLRSAPNAGAPEVDTLRSTYSWFECWGEGELHGGGNTTWYFTVGDDHGARGWIPAQKLHTPGSFDANPTAHGLRHC